ncbi:MAG: 2-amino-4-hydroxy-6-hydroxymethyldihydropteridine diphosphokinase [Saprospiraceae bacterium]|nr:2-amino-4-hydroxy-6-hydroxymethyldihydropteridine diphosphokinase [Saprospiraceae bacterium]
MTNNTTVLGLGSNQGNRIESLKKAVHLLNEKGIIHQTHSSYYETEPWGNHQQPDFINAVIVATTHLDPQQILKEINEIELSMGRTRNIHYGPRTIDIDILFYNQLIIETKLLTIPHPQIQKRKFVLYPLQELIPSYIHPVLQTSIEQLSQLCNDPCRVVKLQWHETVS